MPSRFLPNINWVRAAVCPAVVFIATAMDRGYQTDFWHHLARGREIARAGRAADVEQFAFTVAGSTVRDANWLTQLAYYRLFELGGMSLVQFVNSCLLATAAAVLVWLCRRRCGSMAVAAGVGVFAFAGIWQTLLVRPQSVSLLLFVVLLAVLLEAERRRWLLAVPPFLMALWVNVHGGFPVGLVLVGAFLVGTLVERWVAPLLRGAVPQDEVPGAGNESRRGMAIGLIACLVACVVATLLNPYGFRVYEYVLTLSTRAAGRQVEEWLPPSMGMWVGRAWAASIVLIALLALSRRKPRARDLVVALCFLPLACASVRMVPWWLLAVAPVLATLVAANLPVARQPDRLARPSLAALAMLVFVIGATVLSIPGLASYNPVMGTLRPTQRPEAHLQAVVERMPALPGQSRVFTRLEWGEYLDWAAYPRHQVFMDGRIEIYPDDVWRQYHAVNEARADWQAILDAHRVDYLLLDEEYHAELLPRVEASAAWVAAGRQGPAVLFARRGDVLSQADINEAP